MQAAATYQLSLTCSSTWQQMNKGMYLFYNHPQALDEKRAFNIRRNFLETKNFKLISIK
jgi:hypothetical protein